MKSRPLVYRRLARRDVEDAIDHHRSDAGPRVAGRFVDALQATLASIARAPGLGSPRYAVELDIPGLCAHRLKRFPFLVFYVTQSDRIEIWRVLHARRDVPAWLGGGAAE